MGQVRKIDAATPAVPQLASPEHDRGRSHRASGLPAMLLLQRSVGNAAVTQLVQAHQGPPEPPTVQRQESGEEIEDPYGKNLEPEAPPSDVVTADQLQTEDASVQMMSEAMPASPHSAEVGAPVQREDSSGDDDLTAKEKDEMAKPALAFIKKLEDFIVNTANWVAGRAAALGSKVVTGVATAVAGPVGAAISEFVIWVTGAKEWLKKQIVKRLVAPFRPILKRAREEVKKAISMAKRAVKIPNWVDWCVQKYGWIMQKIEDFKETLRKIPGVKNLGV